MIRLKTAIEKEHKKRNSKEFQPEKRAKFRAKLPRKIRLLRSFWLMYQSASTVILSLRSSVIKSTISKMKLPTPVKSASTPATRVTVFLVSVYLIIRYTPEIIQPKKKISTSLTSLLSPSKLLVSEEDAIICLLLVNFKRKTEEVLSLMISL